MRSRVLRLLAVALAGALVGGGLGVLLLAPATQPLFKGAEVEQEEPSWRDRPAPAPPTAPRLTSPADGAVVPTLRPTLAWEASETTVAIIYAVQLSTDPTFTPVGVAGRTLAAPLLVTGIQGTNLTLPADLELTPGAPVYWRVRSLDVFLQDSPWSEVWSFIPVGAPVSFEAQARAGPADAALR